MKLLKTNTASISGNIAHVDIKQGQHGPFGSVLIMVDDGYFKKGNNGQHDEWIERSYPIGIKVNSNVIKQAGSYGFQKGDFLAVDGKNVVEFGKGQNGEQDQSKKYPKVEAKTISQHIPAHIAKQLRADISSEKQQNNNQSYNNNHQPQHNSQNSGGYQRNQQPNSEGHNQNGGPRPQQNDNPYNNNGYQPQH